MVHRNKDLTSPPPELIDAKWKSLKDQLLLEGDAHEANTKCYRDCTLEALIHLYKNKCAVCERDRGEELQVDHYRPKKSRNNVTELKYNHPGYYWLTYEWFNLIPLCSKCNNVKSNKFPLKGWSETKRISSHVNNKGLAPFKPYDSNWLHKTEEPLFVNPEYDTAPERHFIYQRDGRIRSRTDEGEETISICRLNRRDLIRIRLKIREKYTKKIEVVFDEYNKNRDAGELRGGLRGVFRDIRDGCHPDAEYSLYHKFIYKYFDYFIDHKLPINLRGQALKYFNEFKRKNVI